ncbi:hypothetical protein INT48_003722 [Thamnidium elegans]|uniref:Uncharacterized protein n=1 Tax=Thamnidium elegans TaxID=101142 RepID=A0A8H7SLM9_9FUNG|nr:hypothetical protein INT48_003722 [Thamnidium elegans]
MKLPKQLTLNTLRGYKVLSPNIREELGINEGVPVGEIKNWSNAVSNYFDHIDNYDMKGDGLFNTTIETLEDVNKMKLIGESNKQQKKSGSERVVLINDIATTIPQARLLMDYCRGLKAFYRAQR